MEYRIRPLSVNSLEEHPADYCDRRVGPAPLAGWPLFHRTPERMPHKSNRIPPRRSRDHELCFPVSSERLETAKRGFMKKRTCPVSLPLADHRLFLRDHRRSGGQRLGGRHIVHDGPAIMPQAAGGRKINIVVIVYDGIANNVDNLKPSPLGRWPFAFDSPASNHGPNRIGTQVVFTR
jgi:hypothetical protein